ncbi:hypothetical protein ES332_D07G175600v1 [Gossypium tomentosum]|uniref:DNA-directed RNA polymerase RBP11-like dimerisation domain-containing protein n=1 Tax=Gossypium tomentosum TaxID=34277 RepID=A0A5D2K7T4_GOSTO|nr:hypothetical protein ES332_D07G175600v1 [Gossypium tomentosum]
MEHGSFTDNSVATFSLTDEDHTIANAVRFTLNQDPRVAFCGYSIPHPSEARVNIRVETTGQLNITLFFKYFGRVQVPLVVLCENLQVIQQERY